MVRALSRCLALAAVLPLLVAGCGDTGNPPKKGTVSVTLVGLTGRSGDRLAAFLLPGWPPYDNIVDPAGFAIDIDRDPLTRTETLHEALPEAGEPWPRFSPDVAFELPGTYPLFLWVSPTLNAYSDYFPALEGSEGSFAPPDEVGGCVLQVTVEPGQNTEVRVTDIPDYVGSWPYGEVKTANDSVWPRCGTE